MKLALYSGYDEANSAMDATVVDMIGRTNPKMIFVPSAHHLPEHDYEYFCQSMHDHQVKDIKIFNLDQPYGQAQLDEIASADLIYLSGGNTYYFLYWLKRQRFDATLRMFVAKGGVLAGLSAGAILMTPSIATASYPKFDRDFNDVKIKELSAMGFVAFEFFPHYTPHPEYERELLKQSKKIKHPLYGVDDGGGIIVNGSKMEFYGAVWCYHQGKGYKLSPQK
jgi:dipeptidase E